MSDESKCPYKNHLFICTNQKPQGASCGARGALEMQTKVKDQTRGIAPKGAFRVNKSGCLGFCEEGIAAVFYPEGTLFKNLTSNDHELLISEIKKRVGRDNSNSGQS